MANNMNAKDKADKAKVERAYNALMEKEADASLYMAYMLVAGKSKEYAEKVLNTPLAD